MAHQTPPKDTIFKFRVPLPTDAAILQSYKRLGWMEVGCELRWSHARGTPIHPEITGTPFDEVAFGSKWSAPPAVSLLQLLPLEILSEGQDRLPTASDCTEAYLEVPVVVMIKYRRMAARKGKRVNSFWTADDAKLIALATEDPPRRGGD